MDRKTILQTALIFALFFVALASLALSGPSIGRAISMQNGLTAVFLKSAQSSVVVAIADSVSFVLANAVLPLLPFLVLSTLGFLSVLWLKPDPKRLAAALAGVAALMAVLALAAGQGPALFIISLGYLALLLPIEFEEKKTDFVTGRAFASYMLRFVSVAAAVAVFAAVLLMPDFDKVAEREMISSVTALLPDMQQLQQAQNEVASSFVAQASSDVKNIVGAGYAALPPEKQAQCSGFRDSTDAGIDSYKSRILSQLRAGNSTIGTEQLAQQVFSRVGIFSAIAKSLPLIAAVSLFVLLEVLKPLLALFGGAVYSLVNRRFGK